MLGQGFALELIVADYVHGFAFGEERILAAFVRLAENAKRWLRRCREYSEGAITA